MQASKLWRECRDPNGEVRAKTIGAKEVCNAFIVVEKTTILSNQTPQSSQGLNTNQKVHIVGSMNPAGYVAEDYWATLGR